MKVFKNLSFLLFLILIFGNQGAFATGGMDGGGGSSPIQIWEMRLKQLKEILVSDPGILPNVDIHDLFDNLVPSVFIDTRDYISISINKRIVTRDAKWGSDSHGRYIHFNPQSFEVMPEHEYMAMQLHEYLGLMNVEVNQYHTSQKLLKKLKESSNVKNTTDDELYRDDGSVKRIAQNSSEKMMVEIQDKILEFEHNQDWRGLIAYLDRAIHKLADDVQFYGEISRIKTVLNTIKQEVKIGTYESSSGGLSYDPKSNLLYFITQKEKYDRTKVFVANPDEIEGFEDKKKLHLLLLKNDVKAYVEQNMESILYIKGLVIKLLDTISDHIGELPNEYQMMELQNTIYPVMFFNFYGNQKILNCTTSRFIYKEKTSSQSISVFSSVILNFIPLSFFEEKTIQLPYNSRKCSVVNKSLIIKSSEVDFISLENIDKIIQNKMKNTMGILMRSHTYKTEIISWDLF